jgi:hypothetical protein
VEVGEEMNMTKILSILFITLGIVLACPDLRADSSLSCNDAIVSVNETRQDVEGVCGPPAFIDTRQDVVAVKTYQKISPRRGDGPGPGARNSGDDKKHKEKPRFEGRDLDHDYRLVNEQTVLVNYEEWTYNFGSSRFVRTLVFRDDQLVSITSGSYGFDQAPGPGAIVEKGFSKPVVMMKYGKPAYVTKHHEQKVSVDSREEGDLLFVEEHRRPVDKEDWTYDFGPDRFMRKLSFEDNRLVTIRTLRKRGKKE